MMEPDQASVSWRQQNELFSQLELFLFDWAIISMLTNTNGVTS